MRDTNVNIRTTAPNRYEPAVSPAEKGKQIRTRFPRVRPSILLPPSDISSSFSRGPSCPVLPNAFRRCSRVPPLLLRSPTEHVLSRVQNVLAICFPRSFGPLPSPSSSLSLPLRSLRGSAPGFFPFTSRHLPPLIPLSSREDARVNTCARAMGEKEHG